MNESETRADHIDPALKAAGWGVAPGSTIRRQYRIAPGRIEGRGRRGRPEIPDSVLVYKGHKLAVVEAKAWDDAVWLQHHAYAGQLPARAAAAREAAHAG